MDDIKIIENAKEIKDLPRKNQWELVKSNTDTAESDIGNHSKDGKNSKTLAASNKCEDKSTQVIRKSKENDVPLDSSSNLSSNFNEKVQVKFKEGPDEVYYKDLTVQADQDTSDLHCDYVVSRVICDPICGRRDQFPQLGKYLPENKDIHHYFPHHKSAKIFGKSNHGEIDVSSDKNLPFGDVFHRFGNGQNNNQDVSEKSQNMEDMLNKRKIQTNSGNAAPIGRGIKRLKRMFGKEQPTPTELSIGNNNNGSRGNKQYHARSSIKHRVLQSKGRENCLYHYSPGISKPGQTNSHSTKMQENENISKFTIFDGFHPSRLININSLPQSECSCKHSTNGSGDREFQNKPSFAMNKPAELHDNQEDISIERTGYRISNPLPERIEVYYFDHGSSSYYRTTDHSPSLATDLMIEKTDQMSTKFWAGIFGFLHIFFAVLTAFYLQLFRFVLISSVRPLLIGTFQVSSDYFLKPFLATLFNAIIQPFFILLYNVATSFRDLCEPMARGIGFFLEEIANILRSIRLVEVRNSTRNGPFLNPYRNQAIEI